MFDAHDGRLLDFVIAFFCGYSTMRIGRELSEPAVCGFVITFISHITRGAGRWGTSRQFLCTYSDSICCKNNRPMPEW